MVGVCTNLYHFLMSMISCPSKTCTACTTECCCN